MLKKIRTSLAAYKWRVQQFAGRLQEIWSAVSQEAPPRRLSLFDHLVIRAQPFYYQPLVFPDDYLIEKGQNPSIIDSRNKIEEMGLPKDMSGKSFLDVGCAEGFFVIQSVLRGAARGTGCDILPDRLRVARLVAKSWDIQDRAQFHAMQLADIPQSFAADIVICLSVLHHLHEGTHDIWAMITRPDEFEREYANMLAAVEQLAALTKGVAHIEYAYEYDGPKPEDVDYKRLGDLWMQSGFFSRVEFVGLSQNTDMKDRALYRALT